MMNDLLASIIDAHGGMERWNGYEKVDATILSGGGFFPLKGVLQDSDPRRMTVWLHGERSSVLPYGAPDQRTMFTPERIAVERLDGTLVAERHAPRDSFAGHQMTVMGLIAHTCVEATVRYAAELGYEVTVVKDATADYSDEEMHAALDINIPNYASAIVTTSEVVGSISSLGS